MAEAAHSEIHPRGKRRLAVEPIDPPRGAVSRYSADVGSTMPASDVYFILAPDAAAIKIGYATDAWSRLSSLQVGSPGHLLMLGVIETYLPLELESDLHAHFADARLRGEWFRCTGEIVDYVMKHGRAAWADEPAPP